MSISLVKGQKVDLTKGNTGLTRINVALGWDPVRNHRKSTLQRSQEATGLGSFMSNIVDRIRGGTDSSSQQYEQIVSNAPAIDIDASAIMLDEHDHLVDLVYFQHQASRDMSIRHSGDNLTGDGDGDDETIEVNLTIVGSNVKKVSFIVNIFKCLQRHQHFGMVENAYIRVYDPNSGRELLRYNLTDDYSNSTAIFVGDLYRYNGEWKFAAVGQGTTDSSIEDMVRKFK